MCQPDRRWWKGAGIGIAAGIKLVPLIFIPYLLLTRRFRQAAVATGTFAATVLLGFAVLPGDSRQVVAARAVPAGRPHRVRRLGGEPVAAGIITRLVGSVAGAKPGVAGRRGGDRGGGPGLRGHAGPLRLPDARHAGLRADRAAGVADQLGSSLGLDRCAPWRSRLIARPGRSARGSGWAALGLAAAIVVMFGAWPGSLWGQPGRSRRLLPGADLGAAEYQPGYLLQARGPALVRRVPLARAPADRGNSTC